jgi:uncharacterized protein YlxW (UPF0749 family)
MKLYQALKEKNKLAGEVKQLENLISSKNSRVEGETNLFDIENLFLELSEKRNKLLSLKTQISLTNVPIQGKIFELSELKAESTFYQRLPTKQGVFTNGFTSTSPQHFIVTRNELDVLNKKKELEAKVEKLQEELDYFNHITDLV